MNIRSQQIAGWANYPRIPAQVYEPQNREELLDVVSGLPQFITRGNGKSYGDASLAPVTVSTLRLNNILEFDADKGVIHCEAGVLLSDILPLIVPAGWFFRVTPGLKAITVGGAIASDVHGKNHPTEGCFSNSLLSFELLTASGEIKYCSPETNADLFWQTCGGMGWTGVIRSARFRLLKIQSAQMRQKTVRARDIDDLFDAFYRHQDWPYAAGWIDCTHKAWRGAVFFGTHEERSNSLQLENRRTFSIPFFAPDGLLNRWSIRVYNALYFNKNKDGEKQVGLDVFFYPLDALGNWNRLYGRRGLVQYQFCLPEENARKGIQSVLETVRDSRETPFLTVLKRHGERPAEAIHSFPIRGFSLALDFPRTKGVFNLVKKLDAIVWAAGGKIYLTKDACSAPRMGRVNPLDFGDEKFSSLLKERISVR
jgi:FAD/FMN-containing dehydrogenase